MTSLLAIYKTELEQELDAILSWWQSHMIDDINGGFLGRIADENKKDFQATKGSVLNSRILWTFSAAYALTTNVQYAAVANRAFEYYTGKFIDREFGGVFWTVDALGNPLDAKKQIYALAFGVYALSEFARVFNSDAAKIAAVSIYNDIVRHSHDTLHGGYIEALSRKWQKAEDFRLSAKDANEEKSMNTHLHVLEAFANLYRIWPDPLLRGQIVEIVHLFLDKIIDNHTHHLILFFSEEWQRRSDIISYGHDIEAAWLIQEATTLVNDAGLLQRVKEESIAIAETAIQGIDTDGGLWYEYDPVANHLVAEKHSWPQAEAMIGFFNSWELTGKQTFLDLSLQSWKFIKQNIRDTKYGEWYWGIDKNRQPMQGYDKAGLWKCPYHNSRACMEIITRIKRL